MCSSYGITAGLFKFFKASSPHGRWYCSTQRACIVVYAYTLELHIFTVQKKAFVGIKKDLRFDGRWLIAGTEPMLGNTTDNALKFFVGIRVGHKETAGNDRALRGMINSAIAAGFFGAGFSSATGVPSGFSSLP